MKKIALFFVAFVGLTIAATAQTDITISTEVSLVESSDMVSLKDTKTGEMMFAPTKGMDYTEGQVVGYRLYGPGQAHWGNAKFILVEIFPIEDPTLIGDGVQLARVGFKASHITFGGGTTR